jgi:hypothetical protein
MVVAVVVTAAAGIGKTIQRFLVRKTSTARVQCAVEVFPFA